MKPIKYKLSKLLTFKMPEKKVMDYLLINIS